MGMGVGIHLLSPLPAHLTLTLTLTIYPSIADSRSGSPIPKRSAAQRRAHADGVPDGTHASRDTGSRSEPIKAKQAVGQSGSQAGRNTEPWDLSSHHTTVGNLLPYVCNGLRRPG
jgi:hypothetical protein